MQRVFLVLTIVAAIFAGRGTAEAQTAPAQGCGCVSSLANLSSSPEDADGGWLGGPALRHSDLGPSTKPLWCEDPDDPRCAPMRQSEQTPTGPSVPAPGSQPMEAISVPPAVLTSLRHVAPRRQGERPRHARRLDRPPQH